MSTLFTPSQQDVTDRIIFLAQTNPDFRKRLTEQGGDALAGAGVLDLFTTAFAPEQIDYESANNTTPPIPGVPSR